MTDQEYRVLVGAGPAVVMVAKEDMLKLLAERDALKADLYAARNGAVAASENAGRMMEERDAAWQEIEQLKAENARLLDALHSADVLLEWHKGNPAGVPYSQLVKDHKKKRRAAHPRKQKCVNAHDRCYGGAGGPCDYCEFTICDND
jgi:hypothetical protein